MDADVLIFGGEGEGGGYGDFRRSWISEVCGGRPERDAECVNQSRHLRDIAAVDEDFLILASDQASNEVSDGKRFGIAGLGIEPDVSECCVFEMAVAFEAQCGGNDGEAVGTGDEGDSCDGVEEAKDDGIEAKERGGDGKAAGDDDGDGAGKISRRVDEQQPCEEAAPGNEQEANAERQEYLPIQADTRQFEADGIRGEDFVSGHVKDTSGHMVFRFITNMRC